jgi:hypothetical protein
MAESNAKLEKDIRISHSVIPDHLELADEDAMDDDFRSSGMRAGRVVEFTGS